MAESLGQKQERFAAHFGLLLVFAHNNGIGVRIGEVLRTKEMAELYAKQGKGIKNSNHLNKLAVDVFLTVDGELQWDGEAYERLARKWKSFGPDYCWGGGFARRDVYHYSIKHRGVV